MNKHPFQQAAKRVLDVAVAAAVLLVCMPVMAVVALIIRWKMGTPVLFCQQRPGLHGCLFTMYKFRTMSNARERDGALKTDAERLTGMGRFLRYLSLDELPQLWNVLIGDMSLVGPRPLLMEYLPRYTTEQARRHDVRPGITGWAQINGRNAIGWEEKFALDVWYVEHWSMMLDVRILRSTIAKVFRREGINSPMHATMPLFYGAALMDDGASSTQGKTT